MKTVGRFAPSPTGYMHLGNLRTALLVWLQMRYLGGEVILRIEDLDTGRCRPEADAAIFEDLHWLGLDWDTLYRQSERTDIYAAHLEQLETYACSCSRKDVREALSAPHLKNTRIYPGSCRTGILKPERPQARRWNIASQPPEICVKDLYKGELCTSLAEDVGDFVLQRNDGAFAYHFAVVVDDGLMEVTHVTRGEDLWWATPQQVALQNALGFQRPTYAHVPLMTHEGQRMAKRDQSLTLKSLKHEGASPEQILGRLCQSLKWQVPDTVSLTDLLCEIRQGRIQDALFTRP